MTLLPTQAAIAAHHGLSTIRNEPAAIQGVEDYAMSGFLTGLATQGRASAAERSAFYAKVGGLIGVEPSLVESHRGRISESVFAANLLARKGQVIDTYDGTQASDNPMPEKNELAVFDRSLTILSGVLLAPFMDYVRKDLGYVSNRPYIPLNLPVNMAWDRSAKHGAGGHPGCRRGGRAGARALKKNGAGKSGAGAGKAVRANPARRHCKALSQ